MKKISGIRMNKNDKDFKNHIDILTKGLFNIIFRSGPIEDYHAQGCPIKNKEMEVLNRFGCNRLGYMLSLILSGESKDFIKFQELCSLESNFVSYFDPLDFESSEVKELEETYELYKLHIIKNSK